MIAAARVFPTGVGVNLVPEIAVLAKASFPHRRGGEPFPNDYSLHRLRNAVDYNIKQDPTLVSRNILEIVN